MTPHRRWTQSDVADLRRRLDLGELPVAIAESLGRPADDVGRMMQRLRLVRGRG